MLFRRSLAIPPTDEVPPPLFDVKRGIVTLRLYPYHLQRLHGAWPTEVSQSAALLPGFMFPLLPGSRPVEVALRSGQTPKEVGPKDLIESKGGMKAVTWWDWHAYAKTPLGWVYFPTAFFDSGRLTELQLQPKLNSSPEGFAHLERLLAQELGPAHERSDEPPAKPWQGQPKWAHGYRAWNFPWGKVQLYYEPRDWELQVAIQWNSK